MARRGATRGGPPCRSPINSRSSRRASWGASPVAILSLISGAAQADSPPTSEALQQQASKSEKSGLETVTVEARRQRELTERQISTFVTSITLPTRDESVARWQLPICPLVAGLPRDRGEFALGRVSQIARDAGIPLAPHECPPNFLIIVTREPEALLQRWWAHNPRLMNDDRGVGDIKRFIHTAQPIRVWYNACSEAPGFGKTFEGVHCGTGGLGSRLTWEAVRAIYSAIVVVDLGRIKDVNDGQLADYIAMVGLAQIRRNPELGAAPTILRLFAESGVARPQGLSSWDQAFLKSLYGADSGNVMQLAEVKWRLDRELVP
jgi:hypothetical protein